MFIKAAINGGRLKADHPAVPVTPQEQAAAIVECLQAGANAIHLHVRFTGDSVAEGDQLEKESLYPEDVAQTLLAIRAGAPKALVGLSTGAWILPHPARYQAAQDWTVLPDFASVNFSEDGAVELTKLLLSRGVGVEAGLCDAAATDVLASTGLTASCIRLLLEPQDQEMKQALETVDAMEGVLNSAAVKLPPLLLQEVLTQRSYQLDHLHQHQCHQVLLI